VIEPEEPELKMTEEEAAFDPTLKKKKKKKKTPFDLDAAVAGNDQSETAEAKEDAAPAAAEEDIDLESFGKKKKKKKVTIEDDEEGGGEKDDGAVDDDIDLESFGKKKKKKKKEALNLEELDEALPKEDDDLDLESFGKKKKKKKRAGEGMDINDDADENKENGIDGNAADATDGEAGGAVTAGGEASEAWMDSDRDYSYDELLQRVFGIMRDRNPDMVAGEKRKFVMRPPQVVKVGTKKTAFVNFTEIAKMLHRQPKHLLSFLTAELGTPGAAIDGNDQLILKGRFQQKHIENVLRRYIKEFVTCHTCRSPDTILNKETRVWFLQCMTCQSKCSVQTIKTGFQAVTGKRSAKRAKQ